LRKLFDHAKRQDSAIVFFDEIDSVAAQRDEEAHEASRRLVAQLLTLMDGFSKDSNVVVIAATNRPQDIDIALRRPGRFDWEINFPLPGREDREAILIASARDLETVDHLPHAQVADRTDAWTAADLAAIWTEAARLAAIDDRDAIMAEDYIGGVEYVEAQRRRVIPTRRADQ
jgi:transitional endoplasmic reticulum ATPase